MEAYGLLIPPSAVTALESFQSVLGRAAGDGLCSVLNTYGAAAPLLTAISLVEPTPLGEAVAVGAALSQLAANVGCDWDPNKEGPTGDQQVVGCKLGTGCRMKISTLENGDSDWDYYTDTDADEFLFLETLSNASQPGSSKDWRHLLHFKRGEPCTPENPAAGDLIVRWDSDDPDCRFKLESRGGCIDGMPDAPPPDPGPHTYTDDETGCTLNVQFKGWGIDQVGGASGIWQIEPAAETRADGGVISGCNFEPVIYVDNGGGGGGSGPVPPVIAPGDENEWWKAIARGIAQGVASAAVQALINEIFKEKREASDFRFIAPCDVDDKGNPQEAQYNYAEQPVLDRIVDHQIGLMEMLQQHLNWKTPTCAAERPELFQHWRSIRFEEDEPTQGRRSRITKLLRYRGANAGDPVALGQHWANFVWNTGPVIVWHSGSPVGTPKVWAASESEGKRVLQHAFNEAGIDPNQVGKWSVSGSDHPRYGVRAKVSLKLIDGCWSASSRPGPNGWPELPVAGPHS